jgi:hypothetical protein
MDRTTPATHAGHDELLIARLFGDDVTATERARALDLVADCPECAALFADLGPIAAATAALAVPSRPRDFTLTEADAARLRPAGRSAAPWSRLGFRRSLGASLAALGIAGFLVTSALSFSSFASSTSALNEPANGVRAAVPQPGGAVAGAESSSYAALVSAGPTAAPVATAAAPVATAADLAAATPIPLPASSPVLTAIGQGSVTPPEPSAAFAAATAGPATDQQAHSDGGTDGGAQSAPPPEATETFAPAGFDARLVWLAGFAVLFAIGLAVLLGPALLRRRRGLRL